jgi:hypothetical protein
VRLRAQNDTVYLKTIKISIPSGAIKSLLAECVQLYLRLFQFLLVRLRVLRGALRMKVIRISIPSGAIKSVLFFNVQKFKVNFNSFWCD